MIIAVDVDQTVVDTATPWWEWLEYKTKANIPYSDVSQFYDFGTIYNKYWVEMGLDGSPYDYWRERSVYNTLTPFDGCVETLQKAVDEGHQVIFVSAIKGDHLKSKFKFLEKHFPFMSGFIATKEKGYVKADIIIDDRNKFLNMFGEDTLKVKKITTFDQDEELSVPVGFSFTDWKEFLLALNGGVDAS